VQAINGLTAGTYFVKVDFLAANYATICNKEQYVTVNAGGGNVGVLTFPVPANITVTAAAGNNSAIVTYPNPPNATTTCTTGALSVVRTSGLASGSAFPVGTNQVCYTATDGCGNTQSRCFNVVVNSGGTSGSPDCNAITITPATGKITLGNLISPVVLVQVFDANFNSVFNCTGNCVVPTQVVTGLNPGTYFVKVDLLTASWAPICRKEEYVVVPVVAAQGASERNNEIVNSLQSFKVYPNPASSQVSVDLSDFDGQNVAISLINQLGQLVKRNEVTVSGSPVEIDVTDLRAGFYTVNIRTAAGVSKSTKLVIEKD
jgi:Secretion system C-terminal sorting domain/HYR domain